MAIAQSAYEKCRQGLPPYGPNADCSIYQMLDRPEEQPQNNQTGGNAQPSPTQTGGNATSSPVVSDPNNNNNDTRTVSQNINLKNPLEGIGSIESLAKTLLNVLIVLAAPIIVFFIILAGFKYVTAQGDPGKLEEAKRALVYAIIGGVIVVGATAIFEIIVNTIEAF